MRGRRGAAGADRSLLAASDRVETFLETPAALLLEPDVREGLSGRVVDSYQLVSLFGAGGMGEVYRARDTRLDRDVAFKVLPETVAADADRIARFKREAQVLASLNHPHIASIYGFEDMAARMRWCWSWSRAITTWHLTASTFWCPAAGSIQLHVSSSWSSLVFDDLNRLAPR